MTRAAHGRGARPQPSREAEATGNDRGQGGSEGDIVRWAGDRDLLAGAAYLRSRPDVVPDRIGGFGFSIGGENLLEAAAQSPAFKAVVSEGAGERVGEVDAAGAARLLVAPSQAVMTAAVTVFSNDRPPPPRSAGCLRSSATAGRGKEQHRWSKNRDCEGVRRQLLQRTYPTY